MDLCKFFGYGEPETKTSLRCFIKPFEYKWQFLFFDTRAGICDLDITFTRPSFLPVSALFLLFQSP